MKCPNCQAEISENARFCNYCGHQIQVDVICPRCNHANSSGARFCTKCGQFLQELPNAGLTDDGSTNHNVHPSTIGQNHVVIAPTERIEYTRQEKEFLRQNTIRNISHPRWYFWLGIILLSLTLLFWLFVLPAIVADPNIPAIILLVLLSCFFIIPGIFLVVRGRPSNKLRLHRIASSKTGTIVQVHQGDMVDNIPGIEPALPGNIKAESSTNSGIVTESSYSASISERIKFVWSIFILTFPLWCPGTATILRNGNIVDVFYSPGNKPKGLEIFVKVLAGYAARAMNYIFMIDSVEQVNVWAMGSVFSTDNHSKKIWKLINMTLTRDSFEQTMGKGYLPHLVNTEREKFFKLCSARWVDMSDRPAWPSLGGTDLPPLVWPWV